MLVRVSAGQRHVSAADCPRHPPTRRLLRRRDGSAASHAPRPGGQRHGFQGARQPMSHWRKKRRHPLPHKCPDQRHRVKAASRRYAIEQARALTHCPRSWFGGYQGMPEVGTGPHPSHRFCHPNQPRNPPSGHHAVEAGTTHPCRSTPHCDCWRPQPGQLPLLISGFRVRLSMAHGSGLVLRRLPSGAVTPAAMSHTVRESPLRLSAT